MQAMLVPQVQAVVKAQDLSNILWALGKLFRMRAWKGGVNEADIQQLIGQRKQLQLVASTGTAQAISNVLVGLTDLSSAAPTGAPPIISRAFAQQCSRQLLADDPQRLITAQFGTAQNISNTLYVCGELGLADTPYLMAAAEACTRWVPGSQYQELVQTATACAKLQFRHHSLMAAVVKQGSQLLQPSSAQGRQLRGVGPRGRQPHALEPVYRDLLVGRLCSAVAHMDMQQLACEALQLVTASGIGRRASTHPSNIRRLWVFHSWLLQHQLLDGQGLTGLLTQQQLQQGQLEAALYPDLV